MKILKQPFAALARMYANWRTNNQQMRIDDIRRSFYIDEKDGIVYIIHNQVAIMEFYPTESIATVVDRLDKVRNIAVGHEYGLPQKVETEPHYNISDLVKQFKQERGLIAEDNNI